MEEGEKQNKIQEFEKGKQNVVLFGAILEGADEPIETNNYIYRIHPLNKRGRQFSPLPLDLEKEGWGCHFTPSYIFLQL